jgi:hypothetical protein
VIKDRRRTRCCEPPAPAFTRAPGARDDGLRIALAIEGGAMRGIVFAGIARAG